jgi:poly(3-hydroxybutyrate) depolymerase
VLTIHDMRSLLERISFVQRTAVQTAVHVITTGILVALLARIATIAPDNSVAHLAFTNTDPVNSLDSGLQRVAEPEGKMRARRLGVPVSIARWATLVCLAGPALAHDPLPSLDVNLAQTSVSGLSSGAYMAGQLHVAFSGTIIGAAIVAGGPYDCAGNIYVARSHCMGVIGAVPDPVDLFADAQARAARGEIDPLSNLADDRIYVFSGTRDETVDPQVVSAVPEFYRLAGVPSDQIEFVDDMPAGHAFLSQEAANACGVTRTPFLNNCNGYDQAGALLAQIYGAPVAPGPEPDGRLIQFDQREFLPDPTAHGMALTGYAYVPDDCVRHSGCRVHVAFHGCRQTAALPEIGENFVRTAGYNRWAAAYRLIVLYPQAHKLPDNYFSCWNWWGYDDDPAYATKAGRQMRAVGAMLGRLAGENAPSAPFCARHLSSNADHRRAGRARVCDGVFHCAIGSGERLGFWMSNSTLYEHPKGSFSKQACYE